MVSITKATVASSVWETLYDRLNSDVSSVTANVKYTDDTFVHKLQQITSSFPDREKTQKSDYPVIVISPVRLDDDKHTFKKKFRNFSVMVEVYCTAAEVADKFMDKIIESIETYRKDLRDLGLRNVILDGTGDDAFMDRGGIKLHVREITFTGDYIYDSTQVY